MSESKPSKASPKILRAWNQWISVVGVAVTLSGLLGVFQVTTHRVGVVEGDYKELKSILEAQDLDKLQSTLNEIKRDQDRTLNEINRLDVKIDAANRRIDDTYKFIDRISD